ncbi:hypothetical protein [Accumulibacter sp.]|uniref:hypothetical protein n=1 Tax=Accumulibacter sp. TaxID=2053492 RepID=UPI0025F898C1|nr:hypothetical protein [Accumulibacter sp.]MCM8610757.1 hypothetical protein [Accumulibacter sp.]MCM8635255.1 hypothetical protein [Accumulibacter sp.]MCM8638592.1 hypothetical protein [Accumulibacter sp.]
MVGNGSPPSSTPAWRRRLLLAAGAALLGGMLFLAWQHFYPVTAAVGWRYRVHLDDLPQVSALAIDERGSLYWTRELGDGRGSLFRRSADGSVAEVLAGLSKPDGLLSFRGGLVLSQEEGEQSVLWWHEGKSETLFTGRNVEGLASDGQALYAIEDLPAAGRLLRLDEVGGTLRVLRGGLRAAEGVAICGNGDVFYTQKGKGAGTGSVHRWLADGSDPLLVGELDAPGFLMCDDDGLWISEDATHRARLLLLDRSGRLHVILRGLRSAQTILALAPGRLLLAEQGRGRVLLVERESPRSP